MLFKLFYFCILNYNTVLLLKNPENQQKPNIKCFKEGFDQNHKVKLIYSKYNRSYSNNMYNIYHIIFIQNKPS